MSSYKTSPSPTSTLLFSRFGNRINLLNEVEELEKEIKELDKNLDMKRLQKDDLRKKLDMKKQQLVNNGVLFKTNSTESKESGFNETASNNSSSIKGRNLPPRLKKQQSGNANSESHQPRRSFTNSRGENSRGESAYQRSYRNDNDFRRSDNKAKNFNLSREPDSNARRENYVRGENFRRIYDDSPSQTQTNAGPGFSFDPRLPQPNSIGMFTPKSMNDDWMNVPMNQLFSGYNHHKHGQQFTMNDFMAKKDGAEKKLEDHNGSNSSGIAQNEKWLKK